MTAEFDTFDVTPLDVFTQSPLGVRGRNELVNAVILMEFVQDANFTELEGRRLWNRYQARYANCQGEAVLAVFHLSHHTPFSDEEDRSESFPKDWFWRITAHPDIDYNPFNRLDFTWLNIRSVFLRIYNRMRRSLDIEDESLKFGVAIDIDRSFRTDFGVTFYNQLFGRVETFANYLHANRLELPAEVELVARDYSIFPGVNDGNFFKMATDSIDRYSGFNPFAFCRIP